MAKKWFGMSITGGATVRAAKFTEGVASTAGGFTEGIARRAAGKRK